MNINNVLAPPDPPVPMPMTQNTATHGPPGFSPHASKCDDTRGHKHALCPLTLLHLPPRLFSPLVILADSKCRRQ